MVARAALSQSYFSYVQVATKFPGTEKIARIAPSTYFHRRATCSLREIIVKVGSILFHLILGSGIINTISSSSIKVATLVRVGTHDEELLGTLVLRGIRLVMTSHLGNYEFVG